MKDIWDGIEFRRVSDEEAARLIAEDKAQDVGSRFVSGTELKFRRDFTGYQTREVRAARPPAPKPAEIKPPEPEPEPEPEDWRAHKAAAAEALGIQDARKVKKEQVLEYLAQGA